MLPALEGGGVERGVFELNRFLASREHQSIVISSGGKLVNRIESDGGRHLAWEVGRKSPWTLRYAFPLRRFLREESVDILHLRSRVPAWLGYLVWRSMPWNKRPRLVTTVHGFYSVSRWSGVMIRGERVIVVSESVRKYVETNYPDIEPKIIEVIHRGIDPLRYHPDFRHSNEWKQAWLQEFPACRGKRVLVLPGRLTRLKGHEDFLRIVGDLKSRGLSVHGVIVGGVARGKETYARELSVFLKKLGLSQDITTTGNREDLREIFAYADLSFSLSQKPESFGRTVCEALSLGRPVIGYDQGGVAEQLRTLFPQGLVAPDDWRSAAELAAKLLVFSPPVKNNDLFLLNHTLRRTLTLYEHLVGGTILKG